MNASGWSGEKEMTHFQDSVDGENHVVSGRQASERQGERRLCWLLSFRLITASTSGAEGPVGSVWSVALLGLGEFSTVLWACVRKSGKVGESHRCRPPPPPPPFMSDSWLESAHQGIKDRYHGISLTCGISETKLMNIGQGKARKNRIR